MPSISMIDHVRIEEPDETSRGPLRMTVGGPLELDRRTLYAPLIVIRFVIIQGPPRTERDEEEGHNISLDRRIRGCAKAEPTDLAWEATIDIDKPSDFRRGEARGIAVAVMEQANEYAFETLTWCDFLLMPELVPGASSRLLRPESETARVVRKWVFE